MGQTNKDINSSNFTEIFTDLRADAGFGINYTIKPLPNETSFNIRLDLPLFLKQTLLLTKNI